MTPLKISMSKEGKEEVRNKTDDIMEKERERPLIGQILSPAETTRYGAMTATGNFLAIDKGDIMYCAKELTRHMATPTTTDWEQVVRLGRYLFTDPGFGCGTSFKRRRANLKRTQMRIGQVAEVRAAAQQEGTQVLSVQRKPNCTA